MNVTGGGMRDELECRTSAAPTRQAGGGKALMFERLLGAVRIRRLSVGGTAALLALAAAPMLSATAATVPTGRISADVFAGSAVRGAPPSTFTVTVRGADMVSTQLVKSVLITLPASDWTVVGPALGSVNSSGWTVQSSTGTSICWGGLLPLVPSSPLSLPVEAATTAAVGTASWSVEAFGDTACLSDVVPLLAQPHTNVFLAVAQVGSLCTKLLSCSTPVAADPQQRTTVAVVGTGVSDQDSFVSAAVLDRDLPQGELTCPARSTYRPGLGEAAHTVVTGGARSHVVQYTMAKRLVNLVSDNGAARMDVCLRSEKPFATKYGDPATAVGPFQLPGTDKLVTMYDGFVPRCGLPEQAPCIQDQHKTSGGDMVWRIVLPPGDPYIR